MLNIKIIKINIKLNNKIWGVVKMVKFCPECGHIVEDDAKFCTNCGKALLEYNIDKQEKNHYSTKINKESEAQDTENKQVGGLKCPLCHNESLYHQEHKSLGIFTENDYVCSYCGAKLHKENDKFKLINLNDKQSQIWIKYQGQTLTKTEWIRIGNGGISDLEIQQQQSAIEQEDLNTFLQGLSEGRFPLASIENPPIILKKGEEAYLILNNVEFREARSVRVSHGGGGGVSFRVAKGVTLHTGTGRGQSESHEEIRTIDTGQLVLTNKRLIFNGNKKTVPLQLNKIVSMNEYSDAIAIRVENKQKTQYFVNVNKRVYLDFSVNGNNYHRDVDGVILKYIILGLIRS